MNENTTQKSPRDLRSLVQSDKVLTQLATALPKWFTPEQFATIVRTAINKNPKLLECTPESFMVALLTGAQMGLPPDGRHAHLIPRWNGKIKALEVNFQDDYKGLISLVRRSSNTADVYADLVCENDEFEIKKGLHRDLVHEIDIRKPRGPVIGAYAVISYKDGTAPSFEFMSRAEIEHVRGKSESFRNGNGPWITDEGEMFKKTVLRRLFKTADLGYDLSERLSYSVEEPQVAEPEIPRAKIESSTTIVHSGGQSFGGQSVALEDKPEEELTRGQKIALSRKRNKEQRDREAAEAQEAVEITNEPEEGSKLAPPADDVDMFGQKNNEESLIGRVRRLLRENDFTDADLIAAGVNEEWLPEGFSGKLEDLNDEFFAAFLENYDIDPSMKKALVAARDNLPI